MKNQGLVNADYECQQCDLNGHCVCDICNTCGSTINGEDECNCTLKEDRYDYDWLQE